MLAPGSADRSEREPSLGQAKSRNLVNFRVLVIVDSAYGVSFQRFTYGKPLALVTSERKNDLESRSTRNSSNNREQGMTQQLMLQAAAAGTFAIGGDLSV